MELLTAGCVILAIADYEVLRRLAAIDPAVIIQMARMDTPPLRYARRIRTKYNEWPSGEKLPYRFNK